MRWLNYQHLYYFWNVVRHGGVTKASSALRLAQPTISAQLKSFENVLGEKLFEREGRTLKLTEAGHLANRYAEQIFKAGQEFLDILDGKSSTSMSEFRIGITDVVPKSLAYRIIEPAFDANNSTIVRCFEDKTEQLLAQLAIGEIDLVISDRSLPPNISVKAYNHFIGECGVSFLATASLAKKYKRNFPKSLNGAPLLVPTTDSAVRRELDRWFEENEISPRYIAEFQDRALMKLAAKSGKGIMLIPTVVEDEIKMEFGLAVVGRTSAVKEQTYIISNERRLKNPLVLRISNAGQRAIFTGHTGK